MLWSHRSPGSSYRSNSYCKAANIKAYLGGFDAVVKGTADASALSGPSCDVSSLGGLPSLESQNPSPSIIHESLKIEQLSVNFYQPFVCLDFSDNFYHELGTRNSILKHGQHNSNSETTAEDITFAACSYSYILAQREIVAKKDNQENVSKSDRKVTKKGRNESSNGEHESSAIIEVEKNLDDIDTYFLSIYSNDHASIYAKGTTDNGFSSDSSVSSNYSTRQRHRGAHHSRKRALVPSQQCRGTWVDSMKESSANFFVERDAGWTPSRGWFIKPRTAWDPSPDERCDHVSTVAETISMEKLEI